jgi:hypothetical protein
MIDRFKDYLNTRDFTNYNEEEEEEEEIKRVPKIGEKGSPFKWPKPLTDETEEDYTDVDYTEEEKKIRELRKTIMSYNKPRGERDLKERPKKRPTNENVITRFDDFKK